MVRGGGTSSDAERRNGERLPAGTFEVLQPGLLTTVQDLGRPGYARYGVPDGGAMDKFALQVANLLLGNEAGAAGLEVTHAGLALRVLAPTCVAVTGADLGLEVNGNPAPLWTVLRLAPGDVIRFSQRRRGVRAYFAIAGGVDVPVVMGSRSTYARAAIGGIEGRPLKKGDLLPIAGDGAHGDLEDRIGFSLPKPLRRFGFPLPVRVVAGPQAEHFAPIAFHRLAGSAYTVTKQADRMGCRLEGAPLPYIRDGAPSPPGDEAEGGGPGYVSDGVAPGSIQVPGDGQPIVLLADRQTVGGYPKIATVISPDLDFLAQAWPGEPVRFRFVDVETARRLRALRAQMLEEVRRFCKGD